MVKAAKKRVTKRKKNLNFDSPVQTRVITMRLSPTYLYPQPVEFRKFPSLIGRNLVAGPEPPLYVYDKAVYSLNQLYHKSKEIRTWKPNIMQEP